MQILTSRSAVALEDRQAVEQLIFTAKELAVTAARTDGFENTVQSNQRLGLEMWEGAAYACRPAEEATLKNIFLCNFLERLRDIARTEPPAGADARPTSPTTDFKAEPGPVPGDSLSIISVIPDEQPEGRSRRSYADECVPECERESADESIAEPAADRDAVPIEHIPDQLTGSKNSEPEDVPVVAAVDIPEAPDPSDIPPRSAGVAGVADIEAIVLSENEPYRLESCTATVVLQLLPVEEGSRKCVVSIRTHDFSPHIEIASLNANLPVAELASMLGSVIEKYRNDLPVLAADKLKRQSAAGKKASAKPVNDQRSGVGAAAPTEVRKTGEPAPATAGAQQAGLFGGQ